MQSFSQLSFPSPPWHQQGKRVESLVRKALLKYSLVDGISHVAVALSGGKDSLTLLLMLHAISGRGIHPFNLTAIHVDGPVSCGAQISKTFLTSLCQHLQIPLIVKTSTLPMETLECYSCSRERRKLLFTAAKEAGCSTIAFGHHRDDHAQTILMNLLHKGEFAGLLPKIPMLYYGITIIRPLILADEQNIRSFVKEYGLLRATCQCPRGQQSMRKKTEQLLCQIEELYPHARSNLITAIAQNGTTKALMPTIKNQLISKQKK